MEDWHSNFHLAVDSAIVCGMEQLFHLFYIDRLLDKKVKHRLYLRKNVEAKLYDSLRVDQSDVKGLSINDSFDYLPIKNGESILNDKLTLYMVNRLCIVNFLQ